MVRTSAAIAWLAPSSTGGSPITGYIVKASGGGGQACRTTGATSCTVTGLVNGASYSFSVVATNILGAGPAGAYPASLDRDRRSELRDRCRRRVPAEPFATTAVAGAARGLA
jgi:hypothetical protein